METIGDNKSGGGGGGGGGETDVMGNVYYGNFYLALFLSATGERGLARAILEPVVSAGGARFKEDDLWRYLPSLLMKSVEIDTE
jgi:hypothetical protein